MSIFSSSKCRLFHNATLFGFCITHILNTGCAKIWKKVRNQKVKNESAAWGWLGHNVPGPIQTKPCIVALYFADSYI